MAEIKGNPFLVTVYIEYGDQRFYALGQIEENTYKLIRTSWIGNARVNNTAAYHDWFFAWCMRQYGVFPHVYADGGQQYWRTYGQKRFDAAKESMGLPHYAVLLLPICDGE